MAVAVRFASVAEDPDDPASEGRIARQSVRADLNYLGTVSVVEDSISLRDLLAVLWRGKSDRRRLRPRRHCGRHRHHPPLDAALPRDGDRRARRKALDAAGTEARGPLGGAGGIGGTLLQSLGSDLVGKNPVARFDLFEHLFTSERIAARLTSAMAPTRSCSQSSGSAGAALDPALGPPSDDP